MALWFGNYGWYCRKILLLCFTLINITFCKTTSNSSFYQRKRVIIEKSGWEKGEIRIKEKESLTIKEKTFGGKNQEGARIGTKN